MPLAKFAVLAAACAGCSVYEAPASPSSDVRDSDSTAASRDGSQVMQASGLDAATVGDDAPNVNVANGDGSATPDVPPAKDDQRAEASNPPPTDAGCTFNPEARGDGSVVVEVAHWKFDEGAGTSAGDATGHCFVGTLQGGATWVTGKIGASGLDVETPTTGFMDVPTPVLDTTKPYTAAAWARFRRVDGLNQTILGIDGNVEQAFQLQINNGRFSVTARSADDGTLASIHVLGLAPPQINVWYHLVAQFDGANMSLYVNGALQSTLPYPIAWAAGGRTVVGRGKHSSNLLDFVSGTIDEVRLYQGVLTPQEIAALANP
jgi:Concanavalin A-like lectin/glucanases superfamily